MRQRRPGGLLGFVASIRSLRIALRVRSIRLASLCRLRPSPRLALPPVSLLLSSSFVLRRYVSIPFARRSPFPRLTRCSAPFPLRFASHSITGGDIVDVVYSAEVAVSARSGVLIRMGVR